MAARVSGWDGPSILVLFLLYTTICGCASAPETTVQAAGEEPLARFELARGPWPSVIVVPVQCNDENYGFVLDTGSTLTFYDATLRPLLGEPLDVQTARTGSGITRVEVFRAPEARLGALELPAGMPVGCADLASVREAVRQVSGQEVHGILGMDVLRGCVLRLDFEAGAGAVFNSAGPAPDDRGMPVDLAYRRNGVPTVTAELPQGILAEFVVDTGDATAGDLRDDVFDRLHAQGDLVAGDPVTCATGSGTRQAKQGLLLGFTLGPFREPDILLLKSDWNGLGLGYLSRYRVTFDFPNSRLYLKPRLPASPTECARTESR